MDVDHHDFPFAPEPLTQAELNFRWFLLGLGFGLVVCGAGLLL